MSEYTPPKPIFHPPLTRFGVANPYFAISKLLKNSSVVYSVGIGNDFSFDEDIIRAFGLRTVAVDPTPQSLRVFEETHNPNIDFVNCAVGPEDGQKKFKVVKEKKNYLSVHFSEDSDLNDEQETFEVRSIISLMRQMNHTVIDLLRIDAEGAEFTVIPSLLQSGVFPTQVIYEIHPKLFGKIPGSTKMLPNPNALNQLMQDHNYSAIHVSSRGTEISWCRSYLLD